MSIYLELLQLLANSRNPVLLLSLLLETCVRFRMQSFSRHFIYEQTAVHRSHLEECGYILGKRRHTCA